MWYQDCRHPSICISKNTRSNCPPSAKHPVPCLIKPRAYARFFFFYQSFICSRMAFSSHIWLCSISSPAIHSHDIASPRAILFTFYIGRKFRNSVGMERNLFERERNLFYYAKQGLKGACTAPIAILSALSQTHKKRGSPIPSEPLQSQNPLILSHLFLLHI